MYPDVAEVGIAFTAIGVVTADPASVESVLAWAAHLQNRVRYVVVENNITEHTDFTYWRVSDQAKEFQAAFKPAVIRMDYRPARSGKRSSQLRRDAQRNRRSQSNRADAAEGIARDACAQHCGLAPRTHSPLSDPLR